MKLGKLYDALKYFTVGVLCLLVAGFLFTALREVVQKSQIEDKLKSIPNYNYVPDIKALQAEGKLREALEMSRFVIRHADMPGQEDAGQLEIELEKELTSLWGRCKRVANGFITGSGNSIEELSGGIASDMIVWGDVRDLFKQGYYKVTGSETDPIIASLAGIGLLTEAIDAADWAPAVLKAFRKIGALSRKFGDFILSACKKSAKARKLDGTLKTVFKNLGGLVDRMGLARASAVFKHVDTPADLSAIGKVAEKNADAAYFTVKNGGADGVYIVKRLGDTDAGITTMAKAAKKGPRGIQWLRRGGAGHKYVIKTRLGARLIKNLRLRRFQQLVTKIAKKSPGAMKAFWTFTVLAILAGIFAFVESGRKIFSMSGKNSSSEATIKEQKTQPEN